MTQQESIPVGCVPPAFVVTGIWGYPGGRVSKGVGYPGVGYTPSRRDMGPKIPTPQKGHGTKDQERTWYQRYPTPPCGQISICENITFPQLR